MEEIKTEVKKEEKIKCHSCGRDAEMILKNLRSNEEEAVCMYHLILFADVIHSGGMRVASELLKGAGKK